MCLGVPMEIIEIAGGKGIAKSEGLKHEVNLQFLKNVRRGDFVIIHAGFAIEKIDKEKARETLDLFREIKSEVHRRI